MKQIGNTLQQNVGNASSNQSSKAFWMYVASAYRQTGACVNQWEPFDAVL